MKNLKKILCCIIVISAVIAQSTSNILANKPDKNVVIDNVIELNKTIHDFGDVLVSDGPLKCSFVVKNISDKPMAIYNVVSSCGCTGVKWTREPIMVGKTGKIAATFKNDQGAYPFDKTLTVYFSNIKKPVILHLRGIVHSEKKSPKDLL